MVRPQCVTKMLASRSCRSSVMIGTALNKQEMNKVHTIYCITILHVVII